MDYNWVYRYALSKTLLLEYFVSPKILPEDSGVFLGWIVLKVIFKGYIPVGQIWLFHLEPIFSKFDNFSLFGMKLPKEGTNELSKDGFDSITLKVIY